ncbi:hypothetical protein [uncultured Winogradskyella sp.]|uniref:hypothetical protein n=1 Tax=uncultured Winogradskyella sp. TaxID=395353 RepID=UPI002631D466|nr:hypothetical protein [uncultured Winogradskyella sp.]
MKFKILVCFFLLSTTIYGQKLKTTEIAGETFGLSYNKANQGFTICENVSAMDKKCSIVFIDNSNTFVFQQKLKDALTNAIDNFEYQILESNVKLTDFNNIDYTSQKFDYDSSQLDADGKEIDITIKDAPNEFPKFKLKRVSSGNYELSNADVFSGTLSVAFASEISDEANSAAFISAVVAVLETNKADITTYYQPKFKAYVEKSLLSLLEELYNTTITKDADYEFLASELLDDVTSNQKSYSFYQLLDAKKFHIRVCEGSNCNTYSEFDNEVSEGDFINTMMTRHLIFDSASELNKAKLGKLYLLARGKVGAKMVQVNKKEFNDSLKGVIAKLVNEGKTYSGQFVLNNVVDLYEYKDVTVDKKNMFGNKKLNDDGSVKQKTVSEFVLSEELKLEVDSINIHIFNNRADNITIVGKLSDDDDKTQIFTNRFYSLPLREFNHRKQLNSIVRNDKTYYYYYDDVLDYLPYNKYNYAAKNAEYKVIKDDSTRVVERKIGDYFTGIFFTDLLGLNSNNGNGLIVAEGRLRIPWHLRNWGKFTLFDNISLYASVALVGGLENTSRKVRIDNFTNPDLTADENADKFITDNFNLLDLNNVDAGINLTPFTFEWKGASTFIHLRYGLRFLRTGILYNLNEVTTMPDPDNSDNTITEETLLETREFQVYSIGQEAEIHFEFRPQALIGGDLTAGLNWFGPTGTNQSDVDFNTTNNSPNLKLLANVYAYTDSENSNSGIYVRFGGHYNLGNYRLFPQLLVGYATNLSSFVNKLTKDD